MNPIRIAIIGGGISGLACAHKLLELKGEEEQKLEILVFEQDGRFGGAVETEMRDGFLLEKGPDSFLSIKTEALDLAERLKLQDEVISTQEANRRSFIVSRGKLERLPQGFYMIAPVKLRAFLKSPIFSLPGKLRMLFEMWVPKRKLNSDESVESFIVRRFGREALERVGQAMLGGIHAGDPARLSLSATLPQFVELEDTHGSVIRGLREAYDEKREKLIDLSGPRYSAFVSFKNGMQILTDSLREKLPWSILHLQSLVTDLRLDTGTGKWKVLVNETEYLVDAVCFTESAAKTAPIVKNMSPILSEKLMQIRYESVATINLAYKREAIGHPLDGFGFVSPRGENMTVMACSFSSQKFAGRAPEGHALLRAFVGGSFGQRYLEAPDSELVERTIIDLEELLSIRSKPLFSVLKRYPASMVQYEIGHAARVEDMKTELSRLSGVFLAGASFRGVGIPDCVREAETAAEMAFQFAIEKVRRDYEGILYTRILKND